MKFCGGFLQQITRGRSNGPFDWIQPRLHAMLPFAIICNNPRWRAVARYNSVLSLQEQNDFFRDVFPHEDQTGNHDGLLVKEIKQTLQCMHKNAREIRPPWEGRESHKSREKMIDALVGK